MKQLGLKLAPLRSVALQVCLSSNHAIKFWSKAKLNTATCAAVGDGTLDTHPVWSTAMQSTELQHS